jgi:DNA-binding response OmpR family regulator
VAASKPFILIVEDDPDVADMLTAYFQAQGYEVLTVNWGKDALKAGRARRPDLVILDIRLPDMDGYEIARRLRGNRRTADVPIIFLTERRARADRLHGLELGADDYITKPFDIQELRLRVRNALHRTSQSPLNNPVTNLPEAALVDERLGECLESNDWAILLVELENLDAFHEAYGFVASDDVLRAVGLMIQNSVRDLGGPNDFIGQIGPAEFLLITAPNRIPALMERIQGRLEQSLDYFYPLKDRGAGAAEAKKLSVRMSQLSARQGPFTDLESLKSKFYQGVH